MHLFEQPRLLPAPLLPTKYSLIPGPDAAARLPKLLYLCCGLFVLKVRVLQPFCLGCCAYAAFQWPRLLRLCLLLQDRKIVERP